MNCPQPFDPSLLDSAGLNLQAVFDVAALPAELRQSLPLGTGPTAWRQLILVGHGGQRLWQAVQEAGGNSPDPIDDFTVDTLRRWFASAYPDHRYEVLYPGPAPVGLQRLGALAGWHHPSPFMVGVCQPWGSWYAYRAVVLTDTHFPPTPPLQTPSPCTRCAERVCVARCPGDALGGDGFDLARCVAYRKRPDSRCRTTCLARLSCPVGAEHRYPEAQIRHSYAISLAAIEAYY